MSECVVRMEMPENCLQCPLHEFGGVCLLKVEHTAAEWLNIDKRRPLNCPIICQLPEGHGRLVDADELRREMYHEAFETDTDMQKWDSGCWIRYKMFEKTIGAVPTIVPAERSET